jgi:transcription elongation factor GreA
MLKQKPIYVTNQGLDHLEEELTYLQSVKRPEVVDYLKDAKGNGDWIDNTEYLLLENEMAFIDGRIQQLKHMIGHAQLIEPGNDDNIVDIGETVVLRANGGELEQYTIVGVAETDPSHGLISNESPLGHALIGHKIGDDVDFTAPDGEHHYRIVAIT